MSRTVRIPTAEEVALWRHAMRDVRTYSQSPPPPLPPCGLVAENEIPAVRSIPSASDQRRPDAVALPPLEPGRASGVDKRSVERLRHGELPIEARLDLHGLTREGAFVALTRFLFAQAESGRRCVLVITGKGSRGTEGVLRAELPRWLNNEPLRSLLLAFAQALPRHGGGGAFYILLKRRRR